MLACPRHEQPLPSSRTYCGLKTGPNPRVRVPKRAYQSPLWVNGFLCGVGLPCWARRSPPLTFIPWSNAARALRARARVAQVIRGSRCDSQSELWLSACTRVCICTYANAVKIRIFSIAREDVCLVFTNGLYLRSVHSSDFCLTGHNKAFA